MPDSGLILIVDDEPAICASLKTLFESQGYRTVSADSGKSAIERLDAERPDVVLLDLFLPDVNGFRVLDHVKTNQPEVLTIIMTGYASVESSVVAFRKGAYDFMRKPIENARLLKSIENAMIRIKLQREHKAFEDIWRKYEFIVNASSEFMTLIDRHYVYEAANDAYCRARGVKRSDIVGRTVADVWGKERFNRSIKRFLDACLKGEETHYEGYFNFDPREKRFYEVKYYPYSQDGKTATHAVVVSLDVTARKEAEETLRLDRDNLNSILETLDDGVLIAGENHEIAYVNSGFTKEFGPLNGRRCHEMFEGLNDICRNCREEGFRLEKKLRTQWHSSETGKTYDVVISPVKKADGAVSRLEIFRDVSRRHLTESKLSQARDIINAFFSSDSLLFARLDKGFNYVRVNGAFADRMKQHRHYFEGKSHFALFPDKGLRIRVDHAAQTGMPVRLADATLPGGAGAATWAWEILPVKDNAENVREFLLIILPQSRIS